MTDNLFVCREDAVQYAEDDIKLYQGSIPENVTLTPGARKLDSDWYYIDNGSLVF